MESGNVHPVRPRRSAGLVEGQCTTPASHGGYGPKAPMGSFVLETAAASPNSLGELPLTKTTPPRDASCGAVERCGSTRVCLVRARRLGSGRRSVCNVGGLAGMEKGGWTSLGWGDVKGMWGGAMGASCHSNVDANGKLNASSLAIWGCTTGGYRQWQFTMAAPILST